MRLMGPGALTGAFVVLLGAGACSPSISDLGPAATPTNDPGTGGSPTPTPGSTPAPARLDYFQNLPTGAAQLANLCSRGNQDRVSLFLCATPTPSITGLESLLEGLQLKDPNNPQNMTFVLSGHSSSLVGRRTTAINPRAIIFTPAGTSDYVALGYVRGDHLAEIAAFDTAKQDINFFLVHYTTACDPDCPNSERFSPATESNWTGVTVYGDPDIKNTPLDCLQCHEPSGVGTKRMLRMQERQTPWTHWFRNNRPSIALMNEFQAAHVNEDYAGVPANLITSSDPRNLEDLVEGAGFSNQPNEFNTSQIEQEDQANPGVPGPTWLSIYANSVNGTMISVPYFMIDPYDPTLLQTASQQYAAVQAGTAAPSTMPDMTALFPSSELGFLGFQASDSATTGLQVIQHRCSTCHFGQFPGITRNLFDVHGFPNNLGPEAAKVLDRIVRPKTDRLRMPPTMFSDLTQAQIMAIQTALGAPATGSPGN